MGKCRSRALGSVRGHGHLSCAHGKPKMSIIHAEIKQLTEYLQVWTQRRSLEPIMIWGGIGVHRVYSQRLKVSEATAPEDWVLITVTLGPWTMGWNQTRRKRRWSRHVVGQYRETIVPSVGVPHAWFKAAHCKCAGAPSFQSESRDLSQIPVNPISVKDSTLPSSCSLQDTRVPCDSFCFNSSGIGH